MNKLIEIKSWATGEVLFSHECENNTIKITLELAVSLKINLSYSNLRGSDLRGSNLRGSNLSYSNLRGSDLSYSNLSYSDLSYSDLRGSNLRGSDLSYSNLSYSNLRGSDLRGSDLSYSDLSYSDLRGSDLSYSNLSYSNLRGSNLRGSVGNKKEISSLHIGSKWDIAFTNEVLSIGCEQHLISEWKGFSDDTIEKMDNGALDWWNKWKEFIFTAIELSQEA